MTIAADYQNIIGPALRNQHKYYNRVFSDASMQSAQSLGKNSPALAAMLTNGLFANSDALKTNRSQESTFLNAKSTTAKSAAMLLPQYATFDNQILKKDQTVLAANKAAIAQGKAPILPPAAVQAFKVQQQEAEAGLNKTDALIREMRQAAKDTHLSGESVSKLAKEIATQTAGSALPANIAAKLGPMLNQYMKHSPVTGTGSASTSPGGFAQVGGPG